MNILEKDLDCKKFNRSSGCQVAPTSYIVYQLSLSYLLIRNYKIANIVKVDIWFTKTSGQVQKGNTTTFYITPQPIYKIWLGYKTLHFEMNN